MSATENPGRCEVCRVVLHERPDPRRRRCADHLDQLALVPLTQVPGRTRTRKPRKGGETR
ncbi:hypothetical protein [Pseudonocardia endophytica]|uniref:hypothetical protein n=1 Tax=Pseudonocardia endophytica TaxID=401976 RepID=UPI00104E0DE5|nr:hypothetical protein [Pseudonocardia endophytica]